MDLDTTPSKIYWELNMYLDAIFYELYEDPNMYLDAVPTKAQKSYVCT